MTIRIPPAWLSGALTSTDSQKSIRMDGSKSLFNDAGSHKSNCRPMHAITTSHYAQKPWRAMPRTTPCLPVPSILSTAVLMIAIILQ